MAETPLEVRRGDESRTPKRWGKKVLRGSKGHCFRDWEKERSRVSEERRRSSSSWVWLSPASLGFFLEGIERSFQESKESQWIWS